MVYATINNSPPHRGGVRVAGGGVFLCQLAHM